MIRFKDNYAGWAEPAVSPVNADRNGVALEKGFTRDVRTIGHYGTGDLEIKIHNSDELEKAKPLFLKSYESA